MTETKVEISNSPAARQTLTSALKFPLPLRDKFEIRFQSSWTDQVEVGFKSLVVTVNGDEVHTTTELEASAEAFEENTEDEASAGDFEFKTGDFEMFK